MKKYLSSWLALTAIALGSTSVLASPKTQPNSAFCDSQASTPVTVVKTPEGKTQTLFHWSAEILPKDTDAKQLCAKAAENLQTFLNSGEEIAQISMQPKLGLPAVSVANAEGENEKVLFTLPPNQNKQESDRIIDAIIDPSLKTDKELISTERGIQTIKYKVSWMSLMRRMF